MVFSSIPVYLDPPNWQQQPNYHHPTNGSRNDLPPLPPQPQNPHAGSIRPGSMADRARLAKIPPPEAALKCPRCESTNTKFCYFNNYNLSQPRHFCKTCRRYWTRGGALRNVPVGGGCRRNKKSKRGRSKSPAPTDKNPPSEPTTATANLIPHQLLPPPPPLPAQPTNLGFMGASLQNLSRYGVAGMAAALNLQATAAELTDQNNNHMFHMGINGGNNNNNNNNTNTDQWRQQLLIPNFLSGFESNSSAAASAYPLLPNHHHHHQSVEVETASCGLVGERVAAAAASNSRVKMEENNNNNNNNRSGGALNLSRCPLNVSDQNNNNNNNQYYSSWATSTCDFSHLPTANSSNAHHVL